MKAPKASTSFAPGEAEAIFDDVQFLVKEHVLTGDGRGHGFDLCRRGRRVSIQLAELVNRSLISVRIFTAPVSFRDCGNRAGDCPQNCRNWGRHRRAQSARGSGKRGGTSPLIGRKALYPAASPDSYGHGNTNNRAAGWRQEALAGAEGLVANGGTGALPALPLPSFRQRTDAGRVTRKCPAGRTARLIVPRHRRTVSCGKACRYGQAGPQARGR